MAKTKKGFISKTIEHIRGLKTEMDNTCNDILGLQNKLIAKREELRQKAREKDENKE